MNTIHPTTQTPLPTAADKQCDLHPQQFPVESDGNAPYDHNAHARSVLKGFSEGSLSRFVLELIAEGNSPAEMLAKGLPIDTIQQAAADALDALNFCNQSRTVRQSAFKKMNLKANQPWGRRKKKRGWLSATLPGHHSVSLRKSSSGQRARLAADWRRWR